MPLRRACGHLCAPSPGEGMFYLSVSLGSGRHVRSYGCCACAAHRLARRLLDLCARPYRDRLREIHMRWLDSACLPVVEIAGWIRAARWHAAEDCSGACAGRAFEIQPCMQERRRGLDPELRACFGRRRAPRRISDRCCARLSSVPSPQLLSYTVSVILPRFLRAPHGA